MWDGWTVDARAVELSEPEPPLRILVVDDEQYLADAVSYALRYEGFDVRTAGTGSAALAALRDEPVDLIVLDVMLPDTDGFELLARLRSNADMTPVLFLTARDTTEDRINGLRAGADDYLVKPFSMEELAVRVAAILRRSGITRAAIAGLIEVADLRIDESSHEVRRGNTLIELTPTEFELLRLLAKNAGTVMSKAQILDWVWDYDFGGKSNVVELYVGYLRRKLNPYGPPLIHTLRNVGYMLRAPRPEECD
ncbi:MAG: response regulator transcription factor [Actinomycetes bacterium]